MTTFGAGAAFLLASAATVGVAAPAATETAAPERSGVEVGLRAGYGIPFGNTFGGQRLAEIFDGALPLTLDVGLRLTPELYAGVLVSYGRLLLDERGLACNSLQVDGPGDCSGTAYRLAADLQWRVPFTNRLVGWVDAGFGLERLVVRYTSGCMSRGPFSVMFDGLELAHLEAGGGARLGQSVVLGPFASYARGSFRSSTVAGSCPGGSSGPPERALHGTLTMGVRAMGALD